MYPVALPDCEVRYAPIKAILDLFPCRDTPEHFIDCIVSSAIVSPFWDERGHFIYIDGRV
uniref:Uncharacterized protein n=1 Tax=Candidatus Kentrum sp. LFY TaxID=2126342 RepID=A0A450U864_9GAMM|nr:MAG: hypothetical protein BECKLFY1418B_GA0070995_100919 [Candidatus Kentron sp. LFY]